MAAPKPPSCETCPIFAKGKGFCLGHGDPAAAKIMLLLEAPNNEELGYLLQPPPVRPGKPTRGVLGTLDEAKAEFRRRKEAYKEIPQSFLLRGVPVVGRTGWKLNSLLQRAGIKREDVFIDYTLRCFPPYNKQGQPYPTGQDKTGAELACRQYDRIEAFGPTVIVITMPHSAILREATPEPLIQADLSKAQSFARAGHRVLVLMGTHAADTILGNWASNVTRQRGHYLVVGPDFYKKTLMRIEARAGRGKSKEKKLSKIQQLTKGLTLAENASNVVENVSDIDEFLGTGSVPKKRKKKVKEILQPLCLTPLDFVVAKLVRIR